MTSAPVVIALPFPPSVNTLFAGRSRRYVCPRYRRWREIADMEILAARTRSVAGRVAVSVNLHPRDDRVRDADNYLKPLIDCIVRMHIIEGDDRRVVQRVSASWGARRRPPEAIVTITPVDD